MSLEVIPATPEFAGELCATLNEAQQFKLRRGDSAWGEEPFTEEDAAAAIARGNTYIGLIDGQTAGSLILNWSDARIWGPELGNDNQAGYIHRLVRRDAFGGQDVGRLLVSWACGQIHETGRPYARLDCSYKNPTLCAYYESQGFEQIARKELFDPYYAAAYYQKTV